MRLQELFLHLWGKYFTRKKYKSDGCFWERYKGMFYTGVYVFYGIV